MSISSAMLAGVTGLISNSSALAAISDNIANANTTGYKKVGVDFTSLVNTGQHCAGNAHEDGPLGLSVAEPLWRSAASSAAGVVRAPDDWLMVVIARSSPR